MAYFALFTIGYFLGVITFLFVFPPNMKEIEEQEIDSLKPIIEFKTTQIAKKGTKIERKIAVTS